MLKRFEEETKDDVYIKLVNKGRGVMVVATDIAGRKIADLLRISEEGVMLYGDLNKSLAGYAVTFALDAHGALKVRSEVKKAPADIAGRKIVETDSERVNNNT